MKRVLVAIALLVPGAAEAQSYRFPLELPGSGQQPYITAYRDLAAGGLQDWNCGTNTYDGHRGTDIGIGGFPVMDNGSRWIVAAAPGTVTFVVDGCFDRCTTANCECGGGFGNYVKVTHADGKSTFYGHMMDGTLQVALNDAVTCGQRLGKVGSSGYSTGPHLHFEPRYSSNTSDDPFSGPCGGPTSWWVNQGAYNDLPGTVCEGQPLPTPEGAIKGVVWDLSLTAGPNDAGNVRLPGTSIAIEGGAATTAREPDGYWTFTLAPGTYRLSATLAGFLVATKEVTVAEGQDTWASFGLERDAPLPPPEMDAAELIEETTDPILAGPGERVEKMWKVKNTGNTTWSSDYHLELIGGEAFDAPPTIPLSMEVAPEAEHVITLLLTSSAASGIYEGAWSLARTGLGPFGPTLDAEIIVQIDEPDPEPEPDPGVKEPPIMEQPMDPPAEEQPDGKRVSGGCVCAGQPANGAGALFLLLGLFSLRIPGRGKPRARSRAA
jgi:murein DD-endopeptidase MepM/ murein hydrolase activator NlpD